MSKICNDLHFLALFFSQEFQDFQEVDLHAVFHSPQMGVSVAAMISPAKVSVWLLSRALPVLFSSKQTLCTYIVKQHHYILANYLHKFFFLIST